MKITLTNILENLCDETEAVVRHVVGSASLTDEAAWERLTTQFAEAVDRLTAAHGSPEFSGTGQKSPKRGFRCQPSNVVEQIAYWERGETFLYVLLILGDNTGYRELILGVCSRGEVQSRPQDPYWPKQPGDSYWDE